MRLLGEAGLPADLGAFDALLAGIEAAPAGHDPDAWLELIGPDLPEELTNALRERKAALRPDHERQTPTTLTRLRRLRAVLRERASTASC